MRVLVTGGAGFIGSHVVDALLAKGYTVRIFDMTYPVLENHSNNRHLEFYHGSLLDYEAVRISMNKVDAIVHLGAIANVSAVLKDPHYSEAINTRGTANVLEGARVNEIPRVIYASTIWVYSDTQGDLLTEDSPLAPPTHLYTATKLAGEYYCRSYALLYNLKTTILRFGIPYGPRAWAGTSIHAFVNRALKGEPIKIFGDGLQFRKFIYASDLAEGVALSLQPIAENKIYNLEGDEKVSIRQVAETVKKMIGDVKIEYLPAKPGDFSGKEISNKRAKEELEWLPKVSFEEGLKRYIEWCTSNLPKEKEPVLYR